MTVRPLRVLAWGAAFALGVAPAAHAQDAGDAVFLGRRAAERCRRGEYERGLDLYRQAVEHGAGAHELGGMALCELHVARWTTAEAHFVAALAQGDARWLTRHRASLEAGLSEARSHIARLLLTGGVDGAEVRVGDTPLRLPMTEPLVLEPGTVVVEVRAPGHRAWRRSVDLRGGETTREAVSLEREVVFEVAPSAPPSVTCVPGFVLRAGQCWPTGEAATRRGSPVWRSTGWAALSLAVLAGGVAIGLGVDGASTESAYLDRCGGAGAPASCIQDRTSTQASLDDRATLVNAFVAVAGVGAAVALTALLVDRSTSRGRYVAVAPGGVRIAW